MGPLPGQDHEAAFERGRDGRVVLACLLACLLTTVLTPFGRWPRLAGEAMLVAAALILLRARPAVVLGRLTFLLPFFLLTAASVPFMRGGGVHAPALERALWTLARALICFGALAAALAAVDAAALHVALARLRVPLIFVTLMALMLRYLDVLEREARRMLRARDARGSPPALRERARVAGSMVGTLFVRSFERAERVSLAMQSRGFSGLLPLPGPRPLRPGDLLLPGLLLLAQAVLALLT